MLSDFNMSGLTLADETAGDVPVRDITFNLNGAGIPVVEKGKHLISDFLCFWHYILYTITVQLQKDVKT